MPKNNITEYDSTASNNTDVGGVNLQESSMLPSDVNNAIREVMSHLKDVDSGTQALTSLAVTGSATASTSLKTPLIEFTDGDDALTIADGGHVTANANFTTTGNFTASADCTVNGAFTSQGIDDNASSNAFAIDSNGVLQSVAGHSMLPEFIDNVFLAGNTASSVELQNCFSSTYSVYRLIGLVGGRFAGESNVRFTFLTGTNTAETAGQFGVIRHHDDASTSGYAPHSNTSFVTIVRNQSSTGASVVDMHIYMQPTAVQILGMSGYHDQSSDRGVGVFGYKSNQSTARTGFKITANVAGNLSLVNFSVYGIRIRQNASSKMTGSYS